MKDIAHVIPGSSVSWNAECFLYQLHDTDHLRPCHLSVCVCVCNDIIIEKVQTCQFKNNTIVL